MKDKIEITLLINNNCGVLSSLVVIGGSLGLDYRRQCTEKIDADSSRINMLFAGELNCNKQESIKAFDEHSEVLKVEKIVVTSADQLASE